MTFGRTNNRTISGCCKGCKDRYPGCHDHCEKFQAAKEDWEAFKKEKQFSVYDDYKFKAVMKRRDKHGK